MYDKKLKRLAMISLKLDKIREFNPIVEDMRWLAQELRAAWLREEKERKP